MRTYVSADWQLGSFFTWTDTRAKLYGDNRHSQGEGLHGVAATRFKLLTDKGRWVRTNQVKLDAAMVFAAMHALAMETRRRREGGKPVAPTQLRPQNAPSAPAVVPEAAAA